MRWLPILFGDLHHMNCVRANELSIQIFVAEITNLTFSDEQLVQAAHREGHAINDPVVAKITEGDGLGSCCFTGHVV